MLKRFLHSTIWNLQRWTNVDDRVYLNEVHMHACINVSKCIQINMHFSHSNNIHTVSVFGYEQKCIQMFTHVFACKYECLRVCAHTYVYVWCMHVYVCMCMCIQHACICIYVRRLISKPASMGACMNVWMYLLFPESTNVHLKMQIHADNVYANLKITGNVLRSKKRPAEKSRAHKSDTDVFGSTSNRLRCSITFK